MCCWCECESVRSVERGGGVSDYIVHSKSCMRANQDTLEHVHDGVLSCGSDVGQESDLPLIFEPISRLALDTLNLPTNPKPQTPLNPPFFNSAALATRKPTCVKSCEIFAEHLLWHFQSNVGALSPVKVSYSKIRLCLQTPTHLPSPLFYVFSIDPRKHQLCRRRAGEGKLIRRYVW